MSEGLFSKNDPIARRNAAIGQYNLGNEALDREDFERAIDFYNQAIQTDPSYAEPFYNLGLALGYGNRHDEAKATFLKAIAANNSDPQPHLALGTLHLGLNEIPDALKEFDRFLRLAPDDKNAPAVRQAINRYR
jgi:superkiller protein 3